MVPLPKRSGTSRVEAPAAEPATSTDTGRRQAVGRAVHLLPGHGADHKHGPVHGDEPAKVFVLDDDGLELIERRRGPHLKPGIALQLVTVRSLGSGYARWVG